MPPFQETPEQALAYLLNKDVTLYLVPPSNAGFVEVPLEARPNQSRSIVSLKVLKRFNWKAAGSSDPPKKAAKDGDKIELAVYPKQASEEVVLEFEVVESIEHIFPDARCSIIVGASACQKIIEQWKDEHRLDLLLLERRSKGMVPSCPQVHATPLTDTWQLLPDQDVLCFIWLEWRFLLTASAKLQRHTDM